MKKSIYGSKHVTEQWHLKIKEDEEKFWVLRKVKMTNWIFAKFKDGKYFSRFRHVDNVLLTSSDVQSTVEEKEDYLWHQVMITVISVKVYSLKEWKFAGIKEEGY